MYELVTIVILSASAANIAVSIKNRRMRAELVKMIEHNRQLEKKNENNKRDLDLRESILEKREALRRLSETEFNLPDLHEARKYGAVKTHTPRRVAFVVPGTRTVKKEELIASDIPIEIEECIVIQAVLDGELIDVEELNRGEKYRKPHDGAAAGA